MNANMSRYKSDWQEAAQRMTDWWAGKTVDRTLACITAPVDPPADCRSKKLMTAVPDTRTDPATIFNNHDYLLEHTFWGAEAFPFVKVSLGPLFSVAYLGCKPNFDERTTWYTPCYRDIDDLAQNFTYDPDNYWWTFVKDMVRQSAARSAGGYLTTGTTVCALIDDMAELIGMENLLSLPCRESGCITAKGGPSKNNPRYPLPGCPKRTADTSAA